MKDFEILLPPLPEQKAIASVLSSLDDKIELNRRQNETLEKIAKAIFKHWFVDFNFPDEKGKPYKDSGGEMVESELGLIPKGWRVGKLGNYCDVFRGSSPRPISDPRFFKDGTYPWVKIADATKSNSFFINETKEHCTEEALPHTRLLKKGSLLLSNSATVGVPMILNIDGCIHDGWLSFKNYNIISRNFIFFLFATKGNYFNAFADGTVQKNLNTTLLKELRIILPNKEFINKFDYISDSLLNKILINENENQILSQLRDELLPKLMSGKVRVKGV